MMPKLKVIIKRPDSQLYTTWISDTLANLQKTVDGPIEYVNLGRNWGLLCNEEGKLRDLPANFPLLGDLIVGTAIFIGTKGEEFCDCPLNIKELRAELAARGTIL